MTEYVVLERHPIVDPWGGEEVIDWLRSGFAKLADATKPSDIRSAFAPIGLNPGSEPFAQLGMAFEEANHAKLPTAPEIRQLLYEYLDKEEVVACDDREFLRNLWHLLSALRLGAEITPLARLFMARLDAGGHVLDGQEQALARAVASAVSVSRPVTSAQIAFFDYLQRETGLWDRAFTRVATDIAFAKATEDRSARRAGAYRPNEVWNELKLRLGDEMLDILQSGGAAATALAGSIVRHGGMSPGSAAPERLINDIVSAQASAAADETLISAYVLFEDQRPDAEVEEVLTGILA